MAGLSIRALLAVCTWALLGVTSATVVGSVARTDSAVQASSQMSLSELTRAVQASSQMSLSELTRAVQTLQSSISKGGATYVRWGRTSCPSVSELVYRGYAGGSWYTNPGAAVDYLCLPEDPQYANYTDTVDEWSGHVYGAEYETGNRLPNFHNQEQDVPCAVCRSPTRTTALMIPARTSCYPGFQLEYLGYLMADYWNHAAASQYVCVDHQPENVVGGQEGKNGKLFYFVESRCGSLHCPPYVNGRELPCVVCSK